MKDNTLIEEVIAWAVKEDPKDLKRWEDFMDRYLIEFGWEPVARKQFIDMGKHGGFCYRLLHIESSVESFYNDVHYCSDRMYLDRVLRCHIQYRTIQM